MIFRLLNFPYSYGALEPYIDAQTMEIHYTKHHQAYVNNLNQALTEEIKNIAATEIEILTQLMASISNYPIAIRNHGGGHFNHTFFWNSLIAPTSKLLPTTLLQAIEESFGSFDTFKENFTKAALSHFGSGWCWLSVAKTDGKLIITTTANQDNPLMDIIPLAAQGMPILGLDVWEHAYYLRYQNRRADYIGAFWKIINWECIEHRLNQVTSSI